jgi:hypothetical protein
MTIGKPRVLALGGSRPLLVRDQFSVAANVFANPLGFDLMDVLPVPTQNSVLIKPVEFERRQRSLADAIDDWVHNWGWARRIVTDQFPCPYYERT